MSCKRSLAKHKLRSFNWLGETCIRFCVYSRVYLTTFGSGISVTSRMPPLGWVLASRGLPVQPFELVGGIMDSCKKLPANNTAVASVT